METFTVEDMINFARQYSEYPDEINFKDVDNYAKRRARELAIQEFIKQYDEKHSK